MIKPIQQLIKLINKQKLNILKFIEKEPTAFWMLFITFLLVLFFRTYNYFDRIYFYADNSLFVQAAYFAFKNFKLPQIGPFAQAPFFTGPWWLWILDILFLFPLGLLTPWYFMAIASFIFIILIYFASKEIGGKWLGILAAFLAAISTGQIDNSFMTWNATADPLLGLLAIMLLIKYTKNPKPMFIFWLGFCVSIATTIHFQAFLLSPLILVALFITKPKLRNLIALIAGVFIPLLPFLYFDLRFHWFETRRILDYVLIGQQRIYVPNRWLTYAGVYWPNAWAWIIGGKAWVGRLIIGVVGMIGVIRLKEYKKHWYYYLIVTAFVISVIIFRYFRGERFFYYTNYAHAFVLLFTAWAIWQVFEFKKFLGIIFAVIIMVFTLEASVINLQPRVITYDQINKLVGEIYQKYPGKMFDIYECPFSGSMISTPVSYKMYYDGRNASGGVKIGVCNESLKLTWREVDDDEIDKPYGFKNTSTPRVYQDMTEWWIKNPPGEALY